MGSLASRNTPQLWLSTSMPSHGSPANRSPRSFPDDRGSTTHRKLRRYGRRRFPTQRSRLPVPNPSDRTVAFRRNPGRRCPRTCRSRPLEAVATPRRRCSNSGDGLIEPWTRQNGIFTVTGVGLSPATPKGGATFVAEATAPLPNDLPARRAQSSAMTLRTVNEATYAMTMPAPARRETRFVHPMPLLTLVGIA